ncbi:hypothetical protein DVH24_011435 [Malus domestica]|uniref:Uncharacterized protein n=1 Tax=Malus domestica TaxID=3750 RepID=A0A498JUF9_MALDO|nr:hypothetical protein DVH24_011435 [Malus domestica]
MLESKGSMNFLVLFGLSHQNPIYDIFFTMIYKVKDVVDTGYDLVLVTLMYACRGRRLASKKHPRWREHSALPWERYACRGRRLASEKHPRWREHSALPWESEEQYLSGDVGMFLPNLVNFSVPLFLVFYSVQLSVI